GILLQPNGLAVLYGLGLGPALQARARRATTGAIEDGAGRAIMESPVPDFGAGLDHMLIVRRSHLLGVLLDAVAAEPGVEARFGSELVSAAPDGAVRWRDAAGAERSVTADLVIA